MKNPIFSTIFPIKSVLRNSAFEFIHRTWSSELIATKLRFAMCSVTIAISTILPLVAGSLQHRKSRLKGSTVAIMMTWRKHRILLLRRLFSSVKGGRAWRLNNENVVCFISLIKFPLLDCDGETKEASLNLCAIIGIIIPAHVRTTCLLLLQHCTISVSDE